MQPPMRNKYSDDFQTPPHAIKPLIPYLKKEWVIWEPACGEGLLAKVLLDSGFRVIPTDLRDGFDFFEWKPEHFDCIVTNPPYSLKDEFLERCYSLNRPFALLLPLTALEGQRRQRLFRKHGVQLLIPDKRIDFITPNRKKSSSWFLSAWFTYKLGLPKELNFVTIEKEESK